VLFERIDREIAPMRETYESLVADPAQLESILRAGAGKARALTAPFMQRLRHAVGLRNLADQPQAAKAKAGKASLPSFKQYREADGKHYFKLVDAAGALLLQSTGVRRPAGRRPRRRAAEGNRAGRRAAGPRKPRPASTTAPSAPRSRSSPHERLRPRPAPRQGYPRAAMKPTPNPATLYVIDDHPLMREAVVMLLRRMRPGANVIELDRIGGMEARCASTASPT
jgi:hypothetical protein